MLINIILGAIFAGIYFVTGERAQSTVIILSYHFLMFSIMLPHLKFVAKDIYLIIMKCSNKISDV